jgi:hypothetical protein
LFVGHFSLFVDHISIDVNRYDLGERQGPDLTDTSLHHVIVLNAGAWLITYKSLAFSRNFVKGLQAVLQHCVDKHPQLRARTSILWTETFAANE